MESPIKRKVRRASTAPSDSSTVFKAAVDARIPIDPAFDLFKKSAKKSDFYISEVTSSSITAVFSQKPVFALFRCFSTFDSADSKPTVVKLQLGTYEQDGLRLIVCKGLQGNPRRSFELTQNFKHCFESWISKQLRKDKRKKTQPLSIRRVQLANYEEFTRLASDNSTELGRVFRDFVQEWIIQENPDSARTLPKPMSNVMNLAETMLGILSTHHNVGSSSKVYVHYKPFVEKFLFTRFMSDLLEMYSVKYQSPEYAEKIRRINLMSKRDIMQKLEVKKKFQLEKIKSPYEESVNCLRQMLSASTPLEKLNCLLEMISVTKTTVVEYWKGREELITMDDQLPVIIYIVTQMTDPNFRSQAEMLRDYTENASGLENEACVLVHILSAIAYITHELVL